MLYQFPSAITILSLALNLMMSEYKSEFQGGRSQAAPVVSPVTMGADLAGAHSSLICRLGGNSMGGTHRIEHAHNIHYT